MRPKDSDTFSFTISSSRQGEEGKEEEKEVEEGQEKVPVSPDGGK